MHKLGVLLLTGLTIVAASRSAEAVPIAFTTAGTFSSPTGGCTSAAANTISCSGYTLTFTSNPTVQDVPFGFTSTVNFGRITVTGSNTSLVTGGGAFDLQITPDHRGPHGR